MIGLQITNAFHSLREKELELAARHLEAVAIQKQMEAEARAEAREAAKAQREWEALKAKQKKEVDHYANVLIQLQAAGDLEGVQRVQEQLEEAEAKLADAEDNALNTRAGYVYVISNLGAFGDGVVKIGMTRRLNPMERVRELGDASVPFLFDVHALFFSKDAVGIEECYAAPALRWPASYPRQPAPGVFLCFPFGREERSCGAPRGTSRVSGERARRGILLRPKTYARQC